MNVILLYLGGIFPLLWGISHLVPTRSVVANFGDITQDNQNIITMEWIIEGASLIFIGILTIGITITDHLGNTSRLAYGLIVIMLVTLAGISLFTGFKVNFLPFKLCPVIFATSAVLILLGMFL